jgi:RNA polymerase sigma-70 factor (ECF subfamily)
MTESSLLALRQLLLTGYDELKARLTQRLGSSDLAGDAVQDTWLRLHQAESVGSVSNPANYLFRIALNIARDRLSSERRYLTAVQIEQLLDLTDDSADPASTAEARSELQLVEKLISELSPRQREILVAARLDGLPRQEIAERLGISLSLVEKELKLAHEYCLARREQIRK